jgi:tetratricopeptide (TPR) repeat protein
MKIKPLYIYLIGFVVFLVVIIFFSLQKSEPKMPDNAMNGMPPNDDIHQGMGNMKGMGAMSEAFKKKEAEFKAAFEKNPNDTLMLKEYAHFLGQGHKPAEAVKALEKILAIGPNRVDVLFDLTYLYDQLGKLDEVEVVTNKILAIEKDNKEASYNLGIIMEKKGNKDKARQLWNDLIKKYPGTEIAKLSKESIDRLK